MTTERHTSQDVASLASDVLQDERYSDAAKTLAASALSQAAHENRKTSDDVASLAGEVLSDSSYSDTTQELAASVLSSDFIWRLRHSVRRNRLRWDNSPHLLNSSLCLDLNFPIV
jgi:uncharacterized protein YigA (DUF484 family)